MRIEGTQAPEYAHTNEAKVRQTRRNAAAAVGLEHVALAAVRQNGGVECGPGQTPPSATMTAFASDPIALLGLLQSQLKETTAKAQQSGVIAQADRAEYLEQQKQEALEAAKKAAEKATGILGIGGPLGDIVEVVAVVAAVAGTLAAGVTTAGAGLVVAGAVLVLFADDITDALVDAGVVPEEAAPWVSAGLKLVGSIMMMGGGLCSTAASGVEGSATLLQNIGEVTNLVGSLAGAANSIFQGIKSIVAAGHTLDADLAEADAVEWEGAAGEAQSDSEDFVEMLRSTFERHARVMERVRSMVEARDETMRAAARMLA